MDEDAEAAYQALLQRGVAPDRIIVLGHSLGSGPAVLLATRHKAAALVLFGAFTSISDAAAGRYSALYEHTDILQAAFASLVPGIPPPHKI
jgi:dienelactone hydrolase